MFLSFITILLCPNSVLIFKSSFLCVLFIFIASVTSLSSKLLCDFNNNNVVMLYRFLNTLEPNASIDFIRRSDQRTRGRNRLYQDHSQHPALHNSFFPRTIREWNKLPAGLTGAPSLESFKANLGSTSSLGHQL